MTRAVLQFSFSPWLGHIWNSNHVHFLETDDQDAPSFLTPPFYAYISEQQEEGKGKRTASSANKAAFNSILVSLGTVLLEIAHFATIANLQEYFGVGN